MPERLRQTAILVAACLSAVIACAVFAADSGDNDSIRARMEDLGRALFFDVNLSRDRSQSCATCHDPGRAFTDGRDSGIGASASLGGDLVSLGDRNAPAISYAALIPEFHRNAEGEYIGGQFLDGRESTLEDQAGAPQLNVKEMAMLDRASVIGRLMENPGYRIAFTEVFGADIFDDLDAAYEAMTRSIAAFERTEIFAPFDSKYDRYLRGEYEPTREEELGMTLFFSQQFTNCNQCHQLRTSPVAMGETFTDYSYHNIGVPVNERLRELNGLGIEYVDYGLLENPHVRDPAQAGKFKTPTLRNVAVTGPYMHNGIFRDLRTVIAFYNKYNARSEASRINPETGESWGEPEVPENLSLEELESGPALDDQRIDALLAFLRMLTDKRYESLLDP